MTTQGLYLIGLRLLVLTGLVSGLLVSARIGTAEGAALVVAAILAYAVLPRPSVPVGALRRARASSVVIPDWLGLTLGSLLLVLPVWAADSLPGDGLLHPMAWLVWPMAVLFLSLPLIGWWSETFFVVIDADRLVVGTGFRRRDIAWTQIEEVHAWRRDLLRWVRGLVPLLAATGHFAQAGSILLARESRGLLLVLRDGTRVTIPCDGFEVGVRTLIKALAVRGLPIGHAARRRGSNLRRKGGAKDDTLAKH